MDFSVLSLPLFLLVGGIWVLIFAIFISVNSIVQEMKKSRRAICASIDNFAKNSDGLSGGKGERTKGDLDELEKMLNDDQCANNERELLTGEIKRLGESINSLSVAVNKKWVGNI